MKRARSGKVLSEPVWNLKIEEIFILPVPHRYSLQRRRRVCITPYMLKLMRLIFYYQDFTHFVEPMKRARSGKVLQ